MWAHLNARDRRPRPTIPGKILVTNADAPDEPEEEGAEEDAPEEEDKPFGAEMLLYAEIGYWGVTASDVASALATVTAPTLHVRINSPGGDVFDGIAIYNALADHPADVSVTVDGIAASAASFIAMAGDTIKMNRGSQMMIHDASGLCVGNAADMTEMADLLDRCSDIIAKIYAARAGGRFTSWRKLMRAETWYSASEAVGAGLASEAAPEKKPAKAKKATAVQEPEVAAAYDLTCFHYAGRAQSPPPVPVAAVLPAPAGAPITGPLIDVDALRQATGADATDAAGEQEETDAAAPTPEADHAVPAFQFDPDVFREAVRGALRP
ncbi:hypothetical protein GCM10022254_09870 [Actinomadura meridiana]|uniref:ATP-dependent Clp protease proteolytic subunit n=1 Tax=Actinomadura meridiana TaxID=559626 RepID=A0ABP8BTS8_9ACTN